MKSSLIIRNILDSDCDVIQNAFKEQGWEKPTSQYKQYLEHQKSGKRDILIAELKGAFAGYLTIKWTSDYLPFREQNIPEIVDFNVLKKYQRRGIGTKLMDEAEKRIQKTSNYAGIGVGLYGDYGPAQILYFNRGYKPDGKGITRHSIPITYGESIIVNDGIVLCLKKKIV